MNSLITELEAYENQTVSFYEQRIKHQVFTNDDTLHEMLDREKFVKQFYDVERKAYMKLITDHYGDNDIPELELHSFREKLEKFTDRVIESIFNA